MIDGRKQFARMGGEYYPPNCHFDESLFDRCVAQGLLHKEVELEEFDEPLRLKDGRVFDGFRTVYYTRKGEEWRIPAWKLISKASRKSGWNENFERLEGMLFGYEDWQNDWWIEDLRKRGLQWGTALLYLAVTELATWQDWKTPAIAPCRGRRAASGSCAQCWRSPMTKKFDA